YADGLYRNGLNPDTPFLAYIDNNPDGTSPNPDTLLGVFDQADQLIDSDDDDSPIGNSDASGLVGNINSDGTLRLKISGYDDHQFVGSQGDCSAGSGGGGCTYFQNEAGRYDLFIKLNENNLDPENFENFNASSLSAPQASLFSASNLDSVTGRRVITSSSEKVFEPTSILAIAAVGLGIVWRGKKAKQ
ncbi:MAG: hypothetical protein WA865_08955, partial [Spirulinaceae cyanobacterium]